MAAPAYKLTNLLGNYEPAASVLQLIEDQLTQTEWTFVEETSFTQASTTRTMRVWKCPSTLNAASTDFYVGFVKNAAPGGTYLAARAFESYNSSTHLISKPAIQGNQLIAGQWKAITYGNGVYVAVGNPGLVATSTDLINWTLRTAPAAVSYNAVAYGTGRFVAVAGSGAAAMYSSDNGATWTAATLPNGSPWSNVAYGNGFFLAASSSTTTKATSPDGITWTSQSNDTSSQPYLSMVFLNGQFYFGRTDNVVGNTANGLGYGSTSLTGVSGPIRGIAYNPSLPMWVVTNAANSTSSSVFTLPNSALAGTTWTARTTPVSDTWVSAIYDGTRFVLFGAQGNIVTSTDGVTWTQLASNNLTGSGTGLPLTPSASWGFQQGIYANGNYVALNGTGGTGPTFSLMTSTDASTFNLRPMPLTTPATSGTFALDGTTTPKFVDSAVTLNTATAYDVAVLVSRSYLVVACHLNGTGTPVGGWILGMINPAYSDSQATNPPLAALTHIGPNATLPSTASGMSRALRANSDLAPYSAAAGPESLLLGTMNGGTVDPSSGSLRAARVAVLGGINPLAPAQTGGFRGWVYDSVAVGTFNQNTVRLGDTVTIGGNTYACMGQAPAGGVFYSGFGSCGFFFNTTAGS